MGPMRDDYQSDHEWDEPMRTVPMVTICGNDTDPDCEFWMPCLLPEGHDGECDGSTPGHGGEGTERE